MYLGDNIIPDGITEIAEDFQRRRPAAQVAVHKVAEPHAFGVAELDADSNVVHLEEKPENPRSDLALMGVYFFTPAIHESVSRTAPSRRGEVEITHAIQRLVEQGFHVRASEHQGFWRDAGTPEAILDCNRRLLDDLRSRNSGTTDSASRLSGQVVIEPGARVVRSVVRGPAIIGEGTLLKDARVGPYTSVGRNCVLQDVGISNSVIMEEASVRGLSGARDSLIGRGARLSDSVPGAAPRRLLLGDHSSVETVL
jgi:glucose-1-phosphate thymidylyltransferase